MNCHGSLVFDFFNFRAVFKIKEHMPPTSTITAAAFPNKGSPTASQGPADTFTVHEPPFTLKFATGESVGKLWEGLVEYRLPSKQRAIQHATAIEIDQEWIRLDVSNDNMNLGAHVLGRIDLMLHLPGDAPVAAQGEIVSISSGPKPGCTALKVIFRNMSPEAYQIIKEFLKT